MEYYVASTLYTYYIQHTQFRVGNYNEYFGKTIPAGLLKYLLLLRLPLGVITSESIKIMTE